MMQTMFEKLQLCGEKNLLIQGLPSTIEKQFCKLSFSKNMTPLLRTKKIDFALLFAVNEKQLNLILAEVLPALHDDSKLWVAFPKKTSKIASDLNRDCSFRKIASVGYFQGTTIELDHVWNALKFEKTEHYAEVEAV